MAVRVLIDRPALRTALTERGMSLSDDAAATVVVAHAGALSDARRCCPDARLLAVAHDEAEELAAFAAGADDVARGSDALVSLRAARLLMAGDTMVRVGSLRIDRLTRTAVRGGRMLRLLPREYALLELLARHAGTTVDHATLRRMLFGLPFDPGTNVLAVHVSRVRAVLHRGFAQPMLLTERGRGYRLIADDG